MPHVTGSTAVVCLKLKHWGPVARTAWERVRKHSWEAPPFLWRSQTLREELKEWKPNLSIPQIKLGEPKQTIANWASARKLSEPSTCNKTPLGALSERLTAANEQCYTGTIKAVVTNRQTDRQGVHVLFCSVAKLKKNWTNCVPDARCSQSGRTGSLC